LNVATKSPCIQTKEKSNMSDKKKATKNDGMTTLAANAQNYDFSVLGVSGSFTDTAGVMSNINVSGDGMTFDNANGGFSFWGCAGANPACPRGGTGSISFQTDSSVSTITAAQLQIVGSGVVSVCTGYAFDPKWSQCSATIGDPPTAAPELDPQKAFAAFTCLLLFTLVLKGGQALARPCRSTRLASCGPFSIPRRATAGTDLLLSSVTVGNREAKKCHCPIIGYVCECLALQ
jgi:hypothetical protein